MDHLRVLRLRSDRRRDRTAERRFHQIRIRGEQFPLLLLRQSAAGDLAALDLLLYLEAFDLTRRSSRQRFGSDEVIADSLIFRQLTTEVVKRVADRLSRIREF